MKKNTLEKDWLVNVEVKLNLVTIQDVNLPASLDKFSKESVSYTIFSLIDFFSGYNPNIRQKISRSYSI